MKPPVPIQAKTPSVPKQRMPDKMSKKSRKRFSEFLPETQAIVERPHSPYARTIMYVFVGLVVSLIAYISWAEVDQVATAQGVVRPDGRVKVVNHPEGGRVTAIMVRDGDRVKQGDVLLSLDPNIMTEEVEKRRDQWIATSLEVERLRAEAENRLPSFDATLTNERPDLAAAQMNLYKARTEAMDTRRASAEQVVTQRTHMVQTLNSRLAKARRSYDLMDEQVSKLSTLRDKGYFPELQFIGAQRQLNDAEGTWLETQSQLAESRAALEEAKETLATITQENQAQVKQELSAALSRYDQLDSDLDQSNLALKNLVITAPDDGIVQSLAVNNIGQSIGANQEIMRLVPEGDTLIIEAKLSNDDISWVSVGQEARVKVATYNYIRYGTLTGEVARISPDAVQDEETGQLLFNVWVRTTTAYMGEVPYKYPVSPGMMATVDLVTGKRTILSFLTDKLRRTALGAFDES
ncbi:MAG: HlyD family type I secretion periplasmic adaptor subunit [Pseudomonadota bacterium]